MRIALRKLFRKKQKNVSLLIYVLRDTEKWQHKGLIRKFKEKIPCMDCSLNWPHYVMNFDHRERASKLANISELAGVKREKLIEEIQKCDVVCFNCHKIREKKRDQELYSKPATAQEIASKFAPGMKIG